MNLLKRLNLRQCSRYTKGGPRKGVQSVLINTLPFSLKVWYHFTLKDACFVSKYFEKPSENSKF